MARANLSKSSTGDTFVSLKVTLQGLRPPIWRRILVPASIRLGDLSEVIQAAMGWDGGHLHSFTIAGRDYGQRGVLDDVADESRTTLGGVVKTGVKRFTYTYDFGDSWDHVIAIEKTEQVRPGQLYPVCVAGNRNSQLPPEDCGGIWGYAELLEILADTAHPERDERLGWIDADDFDPEAFDIDLTKHLIAFRAAQ
jgi:hypothetical protein